MKIDVVPEGLLEGAALASGLMPTPLVLGFWGMMASRCIMAGVKLDVFESLSDGPKTFGEISEITGCDKTGMETLLNALNGLGYLKRRKGRYSNAVLVKRWLLKSSHFSLRDSILFFMDLWDLLGEMDERVKSGKPADLHHGGRPAEFWRRYMRGLATFARYAGKEIAGRVRFGRPPERLLDVGGGHGAYSMAFCKKHPALKAEVMDLPEAVLQGKEIVDECGMQERVIFREGDLRKADWGSGYDAVLIFNVIHNVTPGEACSALKKAYDSLKDGGRLVVLDSQHTGGDKDLSMTGGFNELLFFLTSNARAYPESTIRKWMKDAGFFCLKTRRVFSMPMTALIIGKKQG